MLPVSERGEARGKKRERERRARRGKGAGGPGHRSRRHLRQLQAQLGSWLRRRVEPPSARPLPRSCPLPPSSVTHNTPLFPNPNRSTLHPQA
eukprot:876144-Rhodomonas_salina.1